MAKSVVVNTYVSINGNTYHAQVKAAGLEVDYPAQEVTNMASGGAREVIGGLQAGNLNLEFVKDGDLSGLDADMWAIRGTVVPFEVRRTQAAVGATNPKYTGSVLIEKWTPVMGDVGSVHGGSYTFPVSGLVTRAIA